MQVTSTAVFRFNQPQTLRKEIRRVLLECAANRTSTIREGFAEFFRGKRLIYLG